MRSLTLAQVWDWNQVVQHSLIGSAVVDLEEIVLDAKVCETRSAEGGDL